MNLLERIQKLKTDQQMHERQVVLIAGRIAELEYLLAEVKKEQEANKEEVEGTPDG